MRNPRTSRLALRASFVLALACGVALSGCRTQRWPEPMPLPPGGEAALLAAQANQPKSAEEVRCVRHADPVNVRPVGLLSGYPLKFYDHSARLQAGAWVVVGAGGRAEVYWPEENLSIEMFDSGALQIGERDRDEPAARLTNITTARIRLTPGNRVELEGGATLAGDPDLDSGPFVVERRYDSVLRVFNRSKRTGYIGYRDETLSLGPGEAVDLPLLALGAKPYDLNLRTRRARGPGNVRVEFDGGVRAVGNDGQGVRLEADTFRGSARALGLRVNLEAGDGAAFAPLDVPATTAGAQGAAAGDGQ
ncbi:MAG: hypothetical protein ACYS26_15680 [Planctomycetota bacterium]|jgi:hypothetical protein